jgi:hypothetical protein
VLAAALLVVTLLEATLARGNLRTKNPNNYAKNNRLLCPDDNAGLEFNPQSRG